MMSRETLALISLALLAMVVFRRATTRVRTKPTFDWNAWFAQAEPAFETALQEGHKNPEELVNNALRRVYPRYTWPPPRGDKRFATWEHIVASIARAQQQPHAPQLHVVS